MKPFVVCHMMASLDGRIDCAMTEYLGSKTYYAVLDELACDTMVEGKTTAVMHYAEPGVFTGGDETSVDEPCFFKASDSETWHVVTDTKGTLLWPETTEKSRLCLVSEKASRGYLDYLKRRGISYIAVGKDAIDLKRALEMLVEHFGTKRVAVVGGGHINGSFLREGLLDEVSMVYGPGIDGRLSFATAFEGIPKGHEEPYHLKLIAARVMLEDAVWLRYQVK